MSDDDSRLAKGGKTVAEKAGKLIELVQRQKGISYQRAYEHILQNKEKYLLKANIPELIFKNFDLESDKGRDRYKRMIYSRMMNKCQYKVQLKTMLAQATGETALEKVAKELVNNPMTEMLELFIMYNMKYEMEVCKNKYKSKGTVEYLKHQNKVYQNYEKLFEIFLWDRVFLDPEKSQGFPLLNALDQYLMKQKSVDAKGKAYRMLWSELYENNAGEIRRALGIERNYNFNFGTRRKTLPKIPKVSMGSRMSVREISAEQQKVNKICVYFNRPGGCNKGENCTLDHKCWRCYKAGHGACNCWTVMEDMEKKFILRLTRAKGYTIQLHGVYVGWNAAQLNAESRGSASGQRDAPDGYFWYDGELCKKVGGAPQKKKQRTG